jgi:polysaccharide export outer membrane protein
MLVLLFPAAGDSQQAQTAESLLIGPGDTLHVQVLDAPELEEHVRVTDAGELPLILGGNVKVVHLTLDEAARAIENVLLNGHYVLNPRVLVTVDDFATQKVTLTGEVKAPGVYQINTPRPVLDVLTMAGGLSDSADRKILIVRRATGERIPYFVSNKPGVAIDTSVEVYPGDMIFVPRAGIIWAMGDVARPGGYMISNNEGTISVLELVARAGGTPPSAVPSHAKLIRKSGSGYIEMPLQLSAMQKGKRADMQLQPDDIVYVPFSYMRNLAESSSGIVSSLGSAAVYKF